MSALSHTQVSALPGPTSSLSTALNVRAEFLSRLKSFGLSRGPSQTGTLPIILALMLGSLIWWAPSDLSADGRIVMIVLALAIIGWTMTKAGDTFVAVTAVISLVVAGVIESDDLYESLGHELIWLLLAAFVMAAVLRASGVIEPLLLMAVGKDVSVIRLFYALTAAIASTALFIPSTSARAALLLPVFLGLAERVRSRPLVRALALLFPTVILLSASGSLVGAGAHILAVEILNEKGERSVDYLGWILLAMPIALISSFTATTIILRVFLSSGLRARRLVMPEIKGLPDGRRPRGVLAVLAATVGMWMTQQFHGLGMGVVALAGAFAMLKIAGPSLKTKDAFKSVEIELIVFLAVTFTMADAMMKANVDEWLASCFEAAVPALARSHQGVPIAAMAMIALLSHLVITSRTARAAVLFPSIVLPMAEFGGDVTTLVMVSIVGTGLCQTMSASAKPVAIFSNAPVPTYAPRDLLRLSAALLPMMFLLIMIFALFVWPNS